MVVVSDEDQRILYISTRGSKIYVELVNISCNEFKFVVV